MSAYTASPAEFIPAGGIRFRTTASITWEIGKLGSGWFFTAPAGTVFDVSIPRALRWIFNPRDRRFLKAAALHDAMYDAGIDHLTAAAVFNDALKADGVGRLTRFAMVATVALWRFS